MPRIRGIAILDAPVIAGSIPSPSPWYQALTSSSTTTTGNTLVTVPAATILQLNLYQPVTGVGLAPNSYVANIASTTTFNLNTPVVTGGTPTLTYGLANPSQSPFGLTGPVWNGNPLPPLTVQNATQGFNPTAPTFVDINGCLLEIPNLQVIPAGGTYIIPPGEGIMVVVAGTTAPTYQVFQGSGVVSPAWTTLFTFTVSVTDMRPFVSDGANFRINSPTVATTVTFYQWR